MMTAASNSVPPLLTQLVAEGTLRPVHREKILAAHKQRRQVLQVKFENKIWHAPTPARKETMTGQVLMELSRELGCDLSPEVLSQAIHRQQVHRIRAARTDVLAALLGKKPGFEYWVANLRQNLFDKPSHDDRMVAIGDLARELAVLGVHNPAISQTVLEHLNILFETLERIHFHESEDEIRRDLDNVLDSVRQMAQEEKIQVIEIRDEKNTIKALAVADILRFLDDTRFMVIGEKKTNAA